MVQEGAFFEAGQAPDFGEVDRVERVCPRSGDVEALPGGFQCGGGLLVPVVAVHRAPFRAGENVRNREVNVTLPQEWNGHPSRDMYSGTEEKLEAELSLCPYQYRIFKY